MVGFYQRTKDLLKDQRPANLETAQMTVRTTGNDETLTS